MGHWVARHVRAKFESEDEAVACALRLEAFLPVYVETLRSSEGSLSAELQETLRRNFGFVSGADLYWGKDGAMFEDPTLVSRLGSEVMVYFDGCHSSDDLREFFAPTFELAGATTIDGGGGTYVSIYYETAFPYDDALESYKASGADWAQATDPNRTKNQGIHTHATIKCLSAFFAGRSNINSGGEYVCCFGPGRGHFEELESSEYLLFWTDGVFGGIHMPFDGDMERLQKFFSKPAFRRSRFQWCSHTPFAELRALRELGPCASCGGRLFPRWPDVEGAFAAVKCVTCGLRPELATLDSCR